MYKYYMEFESREHMLNSYELSKLYNIQTKKGNLTRDLLVDY